MSQGSSAPKLAPKHVQHQGTSHTSSLRALFGLAFAEIVLHTFAIIACLHRAAGSVEHDTVRLEAHTVRGTRNPLQFPTPNAHRSLADPVSEQALVGGERSLSRKLDHALLLSQAK